MPLRTILFLLLLPALAWAQITVPPSADNIQTGGSGMLVATGKTLRLQLWNIDQALLGARSTGVIRGGKITLTPGTANRVNIEAGVGQLLDATDPTQPVCRTVTWPTSLSVLAAGPNTNWFYVDQDSVIKQQPTISNADYHTKIILGRLTIPAIGGVLHPAVTYDATGTSFLILTIR